MPHTIAERHEHAAAAEVADEVDRRRRLATLPTEVRERAGERDVVDVVARGLRHRTVLAPPGHAAVHELRVAREAVVGTEAEPLGHARAVALDQRVGLLDEPQHRFDTFRLLQVDTDRPPTAIQRLEVRLVEHPRVHLLGPVDADDVGAHVGKQHPRERTGPDAGQLHDLDALQRSHDAFPLGFEPVW